MKISSFTLILLSLLAIKSVSAQQTPEQREISKVLTETMNVLIKQLPMVIDGDTRLDSVATYGKHFIYTNTLTNYTAEQMDANQLDLVIQENVINNLCSNKDLKGFIDIGVIMVYRYLGKNGQFITELSLDTKTCK